MRITTLIAAAFLSGCAIHTPVLAQNTPPVLSGSGSIIWPSGAGAPQLDFRQLGGAANFTGSSTTNGEIVLNPGAVSGNSTVLVNPGRTDQAGLTIKNISGTTTSDVFQIQDSSGARVLGVIGSGDAGAPNTLAVKGPVDPIGTTGSYDIGNSTHLWDNGWFAGTVDVGILRTVYYSPPGTITDYFDLEAYGDHTFGLFNSVHTDLFYIDDHETGGNPTYFSFNGQVLPAASTSTFTVGSSVAPWPGAYLAGLTLTGITGSTHCLDANSSGVVAGTDPCLTTAGGQTINALDIFYNGIALSYGGVSNYEMAVNGSGQLLVAGGPGYGTLAMTIIAGATPGIVVPNLTISGITGSTQCLQANSSGAVSGASCVTFPIVFPSGVSTPQIDATGLGGALNITGSTSTNGEIVLNPGAVSGNSTVLVNPGRTDQAGLTIKNISGTTTSDVLQIQDSSGTRVFGVIGSGDAGAPNTLAVKGAVDPIGTTGTFDIGNTTHLWNNGWFAGTVDVGILRAVYYSPPGTISDYFDLEAYGNHSFALFNSSHADLFDIDDHETGGNPTFFTLKGESELTQTSLSYPALLLTENTGSASTYIFKEVSNSGTLGFGILPTTYSSCPSCLDMEGRISTYLANETISPGVPPIRYATGMTAYTAVVSTTNITVLGGGTLPAGTYRATFTGRCAGTVGSGRAEIAANLGYGGGGPYSQYFGSYGYSGQAPQIGAGVQAVIADISTTNCPSTGASQQVWNTQIATFYADGVNNPTWSTSCYNLSGTPCSGSVPYSMNISVEMIGQ